MDLEKANNRNTSTWLLRAVLLAQMPADLCRGVAGLQLIAAGMHLRDTVGHALRQVSVQVRCADVQALEDANRQQLWSIGSDD